jgi:acyl carrier protein
MKNIEKYKAAFSDSFSIDLKKVHEKLEYNEIEEWDSIGHMTLIADLEERFNISFETDDIVDFSSFKKGKEILKKYKVDF